MKAGVKQQRFPSIFSFSVVPSTLLVWFVSEVQSVGNFNVNRFCYEDPGLERVALYKDGSSVFQNEATKNLNIERNSVDLLYLYECFLQTFGETALDISAERFQNDHFVLCYNLSPNPLLRKQKAVALSIADRALAPLTGGVLDFELLLKTPLASNTIVYFCAVSDIVAIFDQNGISVEM